MVHAPQRPTPSIWWSFSDVNPPVHGWATWRVYKIDQKLQDGKGDRKFLEEAFRKLLLNFTRWVNKKMATEITFSRVAFSVWTTSVYLIAMRRCLVEPR